MGATIVAVEAERALGFIVAGATRVEHLQRRSRPARGVGQSAAARCANRSIRESGLDLWVFQRNRAAIAFYEANGFEVVETTAGAGNEEREPDGVDGRMTSRQWSPGPLRWVLHALTPEAEAGPSWARRPTALRRA